MRLLEVDDLRVAYGALEVVKGISLAIEPGEIVTVLGGNGAGKTTTLRSLAGLLGKAGGRITLAGRDITRLAPHRIADLGLALVPEGRQLFPEHTVRRTWSSAPTAICAGGGTTSSPTASTRCSTCFRACGSGWTSRPAC